MLCPRCNDYRLKERKIGSLELRVDQCPECRGTWFERNELTKAFDSAAKELDILDDHERLYVNCPTCKNKPLYAFKYPQTFVVIDMCRSCKGVWLDVNELREIKLVREHLQKEGSLETYAPVAGIKGALIEFIDESIRSLLYGV